MKTHCFAALFILMLLSGCVSVEYVGQRFAPQPDDAFIALFDSPKAVPAGAYKVIGRAELTAPDGARWFDLHDRFLAEARAVGADAVELVGYKRVVVGSVPVYAPGSELAYEENRTRSSFDADGSMLYVDSFGKPVQASDSVRDSYEIHMRARFLMKKERFDDLMRERRADD